MLAVCCPFEVSRFEDAVKSTGNEGKLVVRDIVELIDEARGERHNLEPPAFEGAAKPEA